MGIKSSGDNGDFGVEGVRHYPNYRKVNNVSEIDCPDLDYTFNIINGVSDVLKASGYSVVFYLPDTYAREEYLRSTSKGGLDKIASDDVDLCFFTGHSFNDVSDGNGATLVFDSEKDSFSSSSITWDLGDRDLEWLVLYTCDTFIHLVDSNNTSQLKPDRIWPNYGNIFNGLHLILASYSTMTSGASQAHIGRSFAENLIDGDSITSAWLDTTGVDNSPGVLSAERIETWNSGQPDWPNTTMQTDHYWGRRNVKPDIPRSEIGWLGFWWRYKT